MLDYNFIDLPLLNGEFTWNSTRNGGVISRIDRWVINNDAILALNGVSQRAANWSISGHRAVSLVVGS